MAAPGSEVPQLWDQTTCGPGGCILYTGYILNHGYGQLKINRKKHSVHRLAYTDRVGEIPEGYHVHHTCGVRHCVNPMHLEILTAAEHASHHSLGRRATVCRRGHDRTTPEQREQKQCVICRREQVRRRYHTNPEVRAKVLEAGKKRYPINAAKKRERYATDPVYREAYKAERRAYHARQKSLSRG